MLGPCTCGSVANFVIRLGNKFLLKFGILAWNTFYYFAKQCRNVSILLYRFLDAAWKISFPGKISEGMQKFLRILRLRTRAASFSIPIEGFTF